MSEGTAWPSVVNLANSIVGVSVLAMPYCFKELGVVLGPVLLLLCSYLTRKSCHFLVKAGNVAKRRSYEFLALYAFGPVGKLAVELCTIGLMLATCVGFFVIIGDLAPPIVSKILDIPNSSSLRVSILVLTAFGVALPLGLLRKLSSLTSVSSLSFAFYFSLVFFLFLQALPNLFSDKWSQGPYQLSYWRPAGILKCFPIFGLAFACQTQLFPIYETMSDPSLKRMVTVIDSAINMVAMIYLSVGFFGVVAFYDREVVGDILLSFRPSIMGEAIKLGFVLSVAVSFPLVIFPCRLSINSLLWPPKKGESIGSDVSEGSGVTYIPPLRFKGITLGIVIVTLVIGIQVPGIEAILGLVGSTVGVIISFIFPSMMFLWVATSVSHGDNKDKLISKFVLCVGLFIMLSSTYMNLTETKIKPVANSIDQKVLEKPHALPPIKPAVQASEIPVVQEARREPPVPAEPVEDDVDRNAPVKKTEEKKIVDVKIVDSETPNKKDVPDKEDYDNLQKKLDAAEEKHDVLLKQLEKQQEQQEIIMEQQNQIIEQLKENKEKSPVAADVKASVVSAAPVVMQTLEKTKKEIADASKVLSHVAEEAKNVETVAEKKVRDAAAALKVESKTGSAAADKMSEENDLSKKVEEAAKFIEEDEKKKKAAAAAAAAVEKAKKEEEARATKKHEDSLAKKVEEAARYLAEQEAKKKKLAEEEEKKKKEVEAARVIADAKLAAEEAKKKEAEAVKAAEIAVQKVAEAKKAAYDAESKNNILKEVAATTAPDAAGKNDTPVEKAASPDSEAIEESVKPEAAQPAAGVAVKDADELKKKLETHEKLIVKMHQKIQDYEKEKDAKKEVPITNMDGRKENPKPLGLKAVAAADPAAAAASVNSAPASAVDLNSAPSAAKLKSTGGVRANLPVDVVKTENLKETVEKMAAKEKQSEDADL